MNINLKSLLLGTSLSLIPVLTNAQCVATTDCASLGYTETSCPDGKGLKCPFGSTFACPATDKSVCEKNGFKYTCTGEGYTGGEGLGCNNQYTSCICASGYGWKNNKCDKITPAFFGQCTGYAKNCKIGDILNNDGTCSSDKVDGKTPIGIVAYIGKDNCGQAIALSDVGASGYWSSKCIDIPTLPNLELSSAQQDYDSCGNTQKIIALSNSRIYYAAWQAVEHTPTTAPMTKGKWCLPAAGIGQSMLDNYPIINAGLFKAGGTLLPDTRDHWYWSSSEYGKNIVWQWNFGEKDVRWVNDKDHLNYPSYVRPVLIF